MRDLLILAIVVLASIAALRRPWIGVILWVWIGVMNPHRYTYGIAYDAPIALVAAGATDVVPLPIDEWITGLRVTPRGMVLYGKRPKQ